ncbi:MAG: hypothetical protein EB120_00875 [Proteobacteria bacterium]|nr:hypothetical protein [Pseudomonadota bacterium]
MNIKSRYELISDYDYLNKLTEKEKEWLNKFTKEYVNADLNSKDLNENFHNTKSLKKDCYDRNNARNRCVWTKMKASGNQVYTQEIPETKKVQKNDDYEEYLIKVIDKGKNKKK